MNNRDKILAEFDEVFYEIMGLETDPDGTPDMLLIRDEDDYVLNSISFTQEKEAIKAFITTAIAQTIAEERERVVMEIRKRMPSHDAVTEYLSSLDIKK